MTARVALVAFTLALTAGTVRAEIPPPPDEVSIAYEAALADLRAGMDRQAIADRLKSIIEKRPDSTYASLARSFLADLTASAKNPAPKPDDPPEKRLADARIPFLLLKYADNWGGSLKEYVAKEPKDPAAALVAADRAVIARLIPLLADRSPTRCGDQIFRDRWSTPQPRVCDLALALIEYHGQCRFHHDQIYGRYLHQLPEADRQKVATRVAEWWAEVKNKSVAAGVRAQLPFAGSYPEAVWMAKTLARLGDEEKTDDREFALNFLREMVKENCRSNVGANAANALAELGDMSAVDIFYAEWKSWLGRPGLIHDPYIAFYLCKHGQRREWELLYAISQEEVRDGKGPGDGAVWSCVVNSGVASTNPYAIPILALALDQTENTGSRGVGDRVQSFSYADTACELFQKQVGKDFGYQQTGTPAERRAAIKRAQRWWEAEGKAKYTFDYIEKNLGPATAPPPRLKK